MPEAQHEAEDTIPEPDEENPLDRVTDPAFRIKTTATPIRLFFRLVNACVDEAKITVGERDTAEWNNGEVIDGLHVRAVDPANVFMVNATIPAEAGGFSTWDLGGETYKIATTVKRLQKTLGYARMAGQGVNDHGDPIAIRYDDDLRRLETTVTRPNQRTQRVTSWNLLDPDTVRKEPDIPQLELDNVGFFESTRALKDAVGELKSTSDHVSVRSDPDAEDTFQFYTEGDMVQSDFIRFTDSYQVQTSDDRAEDVRGQSSLFSMDYLRDIVKALHRAKMDKVNVRWGDEFPAVFRFFNEEYGIRGHFLLAPRIQQEDDEQ